MFARLSVIVFLTLALTGCAKDRTAAPTTEPESPLATGVEGDNNPAFHDKLLTIARVYRVYGRINDRWNWAVADCAGPPPPRALYSRSSDQSTHGRKIYSLFARYPDAYAWNSDIRDQVVVKESWVPVEVDRASVPSFLEGVPLAGADHGQEPIAVPEDLRPSEEAIQMLRAPDGRLCPPNSAFSSYLAVGDKTYRAARRGDLFIMYHLDPSTPGTDNGWVYGTVTPDGKTVTSAGRVASCMRCHQSLSGRLFGLRY
jgi:hypothetical protein